MTVMMAYFVVVVRAVVVVVVRVPRVVSVRQLAKLARRVGNSHSRHSQCSNAQLLTVCATNKANHCFLSARKVHYLCESLHCSSLEPAASCGSDIDMASSSDHVLYFLHSHHINRYKRSLQPSLGLFPYLPKL